MFVRTIAGWIIIASGTTLAAVSAVIAYEGFVTMTGSSLFGWAGPAVAASLIGLGIAVESEIRARRWVAAAVLGVLLIGAGLLDRHSGELALKAKVEAAAQVDADRLQAFETAAQAKADAESVIKDREAKLATLTGSDVVAAQRILGVTPDGRWGPQTTAAMQALAADLRAEIVQARDDARKYVETVAKGAPASSAPFTLHDAELYATLITVLSIVLAFAGSYVAHGLRKDPTIEEQVSEMETAVESVEAQVFDLAAFLAARQA